MADLNLLTSQTNLRRGMAYAGELIGIGFIYFVLAKTGEKLKPLMGRLISQQLGETLELE